MRGRQGWAADFASPTRMGGRFRDFAFLVRFDLGSAPPLIDATRTRLAAARMCCGRGVVATAGQGPVGVVDEYVEALAVADAEQGKVPSTFF